MHGSRRLSPAWLAFGLTLGVRTLIALSRLDELELDLYSGSLAWAAVQGLPLDPEHLPIIAHLRGSVVTALLLVPLYALFGPSMLALKAVAVLWSGATAALLARLFERHAGRRAGLAVAVGFALLPPSFQMVSVLALGSHGETVLFYSAAALALLGPAAPLGARACLAFGAVAGAGLCFSLHFLVCLPPLLSCWWLRDRRCLLRRATLAVPLGAAPFLALIPLLTRDTTVQGKPASSHFLPEGPAAALTKLWDTVVHDLRPSLLFEEHGGAWAAWLWCAAVIVGLVLTARRVLRGDPLSVFVCGYAALFLVAHSLTDFEINFYNTLDGMGSRYTMPLLPLLLGLVALGAEELGRAGRNSAALALVLAVALPGASGVAHLADPGLVLRQPPMLGTQLANFEHHFEHAAPTDLAARLAWVERVDPDWAALRPLFYENLALPVRSGLADVWALVADVHRTRTHAPALRPYMLGRLGMDAGLASGAPGERRPTGELLLAWLHELETLRALRGPEAPEVLTSTELAWIVRGAARVVPGEMFVRRFVTGKRDMLAFEFVARLPERLRRHGAEGLGFMAGRTVTPYHQAFLDLLADADALDPELRESFWTAVGLAYRSRFREERFVVPEPGAIRIEALMPAEGRAWFRAGLGLPRGCVDT